MLYASERLTYIHSRVGDTTQRNVVIAGELTAQADSVAANSSHSGSGTTKFSCTKIAAEPRDSVT